MWWQLGWYCVIEALVSNMLVLASAGKMEDRVVKEMLDS